AGKPVTNQHPRQQGSEEGVHQRGNQRGSKGQAISGQGPFGCGQVTKIGGGDAGGTEEKRAGRNQHDGGERNGCESESETKSGQAVVLWFGHLTIELLDMVEDSAFAEVNLLRLLPPAKDFVNGE